MATSLAAQLKRLQAPQTSLLLQDKKRPSLLFDPKEAANYDRQTIYELGVAGLEELKTLYARFSEFESTLFDISSISLERGVQSKEVNKKLDANIKKFFYLLSPYFLLKPAHKALEWLVQRFHVHQYNAEDFFMLALPYHESRIFIRVMQLIDFSSGSNPWHWLQPLQKKGIPLSKSALLNHAATNPSFLRQLCDATMGAVKEHGQYAGVLSTLLAFYSTTLLGVLDRCKGKLTELQMVHIVDTLQRGLGSSVLDFAAASYIIFGRLVTNVSLTKQILERLINRISKVDHSELQTEKAMLLVLIYQCQNKVLKGVPVRTLSRLAAQKETASTYGLLASKGFDVVPFLVPLMRESIALIQTQLIGNNSDLRCLVENLINEVRFSENGAESVVRMFIEAFDISALEESSGKPLVALGEINSPQEIVEWYSKILKQLERSYPSVFDKAVCRALKGLGVSPSQASVLRQMLGFELQLDLFDKLHHQKNRIRAEALLGLAKQCKTLKVKDEQTLKESLLDVLKDDSALVVLAALSFPVPVLKRILSRSPLHSRLVGVLQSHVLAAGSDSKWAHVIPAVISTLTQIGEGDPIEEFESLVALLPHMLVEQSYIESVLASPLSSRNQFLVALKSEKKKNIEGIYNIIFNKPGVVDIQLVLDYGKKLAADGSSNHIESKFALLLLLASSLPTKASVEISLDALHLACSLIKGLKMNASGELSQLSPSSLTQCISVCKKGYIPLEGHLLVLQTIIKRSNLKISQENGSWLDLETMSPSARLLVELYTSLSEGCASEDSKTQSAYVSALKSYFKVYFPSQQKQVEFLANFWACHCLLKYAETEERELSMRIQLRSLRLGKLILSSTKDVTWAKDLSVKNIVFPALLVALYCPAAPVRIAALDIIQDLNLTQSKNRCQSFDFLSIQIQDSIQELSLDAEQLQLVLYSTISPDPVVQSMLSPECRTAAPNMLDALLSIVQNKHTPQYISSALLTVLTSVNSELVLKKLLTLVVQIMSANEGKQNLNIHSSTIINNVAHRIDSQTAKIFSSDIIWTVMTELLANHQTVLLSEDGKSSSPAELACGQITRELWDALPAPQSTIQQRLLSMLIAAGTEAENPSVLSAVSKSFKQLSVDAILIVNELNKMKDINVVAANSNQARRRSTIAHPSPQILETKEWRCGMTLLELLQNKKKLINPHLLLPVLFDLLKRCLYFEEQAPVEYAKQLILSCVLHCCQKLAPDGATLLDNVSSELVTRVLDIESIVHCVRGTQNPQTHHHALLLLAHVAGLVPEQVLLNIMSIFTFMGSLVLRQDDAYSFQIISKVVDTIIPILIKASKSGTFSANANSQLDATIASIMRVFVDALLDIPEHRRLSLFHKVLTTLDPQQYMWLFLCLVMESHTVHHSESTNDNRKTRGISSSSEAPKRIEVALQIVTQFAPDVILSNCVQLLKYLLSLPLEKGDIKRPMFKGSDAIGNLDKFRVKSLFDVNHQTPKHLRHYKHTIVTFLSALLSSLPFVNQISNMDEEATDILVPVYIQLLEVLLVLIQVFSRQSDITVGTPTAKYWRVMVAQAYDILDKVNALLPSKLFLNIVSGLMVHELPALRRKAMELLNSRLSSSQREVFLSSCESTDLLNLLEPLLAVVKTIETRTNSELNEEVFLNQQTALLSIKYLAKNLAYENFKKFKPILEFMTSLICKNQIQNSNLLASVALCAAELCSSLRAHAIASLPILMPAFIKLMAAQITQAPDVVQVSLAASLYRIVESLAAFISPYLHPLLVELCGLSATHFQEEEDQAKAAYVAAKLKGTRQKLSSTVPTRVLVPAVESAYKDLVSKKQLDAVGPLMSVLAESFVGLASADITALQSTLSDFFLSALQFRSTSGIDLTQEQVDIVENHVVKALVAFVLKLSETSFRPLYFRFYEWATHLNDSNKERTITFYKLSHGIAECLKGLYVSFAGHLIKNAAELLDHCNVSKIGEKDSDDELPHESDGPRHQELFFGSGQAAEEKSAALVNSILKTLNYVFLYDSQNFLSKERFETLMQPIVDQLENTLGGVEGLRQRATDVLVPCISQMALACSDDTLWKQLNYQILLKTRHTTPMVRLVSLEAVCGVARKLGEGFLPLLPETVPFLAELLEDEEESIETACRRAVQDLEQVLGEPIQKYF
ncbi:HEAT repeat-containing protein 1 [Frankliniella fusca]|uniref:HEAT repeat-containing protein 1 n=1 Tax=Frankliniella fusca TaxID=407009 RepID=A0AAE1GZV3_9NEOP|nr:HEAT repeat-containing protein 1 [Frankliniella fusca]